MNFRNTRQSILFLQLSQPDIDPRAANENIPLAAAYLCSALNRSEEKKHYRAIIQTPGINRLCNTGVISEILEVRPSIAAFTLYLWNIERSLRLMKEIRKRLPDTIIMAGGPEVTADNTLLFRNRLVDIAVTGEGEHLFPKILKAIRLKKKPDFQNVAWRSGKDYMWGTIPQAVRPLRKTLPPAGYKIPDPSVDGIAYMETTRGCRMGCTFCYYNRRRTNFSWISANDAIKRINALRTKGAREIRFIDPTLNSHPEFDILLKKLAEINAGKKLSFFAELRADTLTAAQARLLKEANFREIEIGVQSLDPAVLRNVNRPTVTKNVLRGIGMLEKNRLPMTLDLMCGLPGQKLSDIRTSLKTLSRIKNANIQFLHTLLLPGTQLRSDAKHFKLLAQKLPPYRVLSTGTLTPGDIHKADRIAEKITGRAFDYHTPHFTGHKITDLFEERIHVDAGNFRHANLRGSSNSRCVFFHGPNLFAKRTGIAEAIRRSIRREPDCLWQFVLCFETEEPLNILDLIIETLDALPDHHLDRQMIPDESGAYRISRRVFIKLDKKKSFSKSWSAEADRLLKNNFR